MSVPRRDDVLRTGKRRLHVISTQTYNLLLRNTELLFDMQSSIYTPLDIGANFGLKMGISEGSWTSILPGYSKYH